MHEEAAPQQDKEGGRKGLAVFCAGIDRILEDMYAFVNPNGSDG